MEKHFHIILNKTDKEIVKEYIKKLIIGLFGKLYFYKETIDIKEEIIQIDDKKRISLYIIKQLGFFLKTMFSSNKK